MNTIHLTQSSHKRSTSNIFESPVEWAKSIERRYEDAQKRLLDAQLVFNDDIDNLTVYRNQLRTDLLPKYEAAIKPFFEALLLRDKDIPTPPELKAAIDFTYPNDLQPKSIHKNLTTVAQEYSRSIVGLLDGKNLTKLHRGDVVSIAITTAIQGIAYLFTASQQRIKLEKLQADVDIVCSQISGAIRTFGAASKVIRDVKLMHDRAVNRVERDLHAVTRLSSTGKKLSDLEESEQRVVEACYRAGESLKEIIKKDFVETI